MLFTHTMKNKLILHGALHIKGSFHNVEWDFNILRVLFRTIPLEQKREIQILARRNKRWGGLVAIYMIDLFLP